MSGGEVQASHSPSLPPSPVSLSPPLSSLFCPSLWPICVSQTLPPLPLSFSPLSSQSRSLPPLLPSRWPPFVRKRWWWRWGSGQLFPQSVCVCVCLDSVGMCVRKSCRQSSVKPQSVCVRRWGHTGCQSISGTCKLGSSAAARRTFCF